jgi:outer membrane protein assembly factor BamE (lipoprotein component of BamABCDE complex)
MSPRFRHRSLLAVLVAATALTAGCTRMQEHQGFLLDEQLAGGIQAGVDNRDSVVRTLGRPSFVGQFDQNDWYYVSRQTRQLAFNHPNPVAQTVMRVRFDAAGNVTAVDRTGVELIAQIEPSNEETPTLGRNRSFFEEIFGNIGAAGGPTERGQSADNPQ